MEPRIIKQKSKQIIKEIRREADIENRPINDKRSIEMMYDMLRVKMSQPDYKEKGK